MNFSTAEGFKYLVFTAMNFHTMARTVQQQNFSFCSVVAKTCKMCFTSIAGYGIIVQALLFNLY